MQGCVIWNKFILLHELNLYPPRELEQISPAVDSVALQEIEQISMDTPLSLQDQSITDSMGPGFINSRKRK